MPRILFITGTDTGVGKTLLTALLLRSMRRQGVRARAIKPFSSGSVADARLLARLQRGELTCRQINPFHFPEPVAPLVAARKSGASIPLGRVVRHIRRLAARCECLLVEGCGGVKVPLGTGYCVADLIGALECGVLVVARNALGTINHSILTIEALRNYPHRDLRLVLMHQASPDPSAITNPSVLRHLLAGIEVHEVEFLGHNALTMKGIETNCKILKKTLAQISGFDTFKSLRQTWSGGWKKAEKSA